MRSITLGAHDTRDTRRVAFERLSIQSCAVRWAPRRARLRAEPTAVAVGRDYYQRELNLRGAHTVSCELENMKWESQQGPLMFFPR